MLTCANCGQENPDGFKFCGACAAPLTQQVPSGREERKVVTVLFCDLVGSTARAEQLDPEDVRALLSGYHERVRKELERFGGTVEKFIGDAVMALFGAPLAHEDDPERAVRAALAIRDSAREAEDIQVRIGITTGEALVALGANPQGGEGMAAGDVVNTAARLQSAAAVNGILVDETTYRATDRAIDYREHSPIDAKGKVERVRVWEAIEPRSRLGVDVEQAPRTGLIGRDRELTLLREAFERTREASELQLVTLVGVPGIGKSRAVYELSRIVEADPELVVWRQGRCLPYGDGVSFWALAEMVKAEAGILESDEPEVVAAKLRTSIAGLLPPADVEWVELRLRPLVGLGGGEAGAHGVREEAFPAWRRYLESVAEQGSAVLVFEDLHWADDGLLDFLDELTEWTSGVPLLLLCTTRPELFARRPGWGGGRTNALTLSLRPLSPEETARLVHDVLEQAVLPADLQQTLVERAGGNPLYAEEFGRMLAERGEAELTVPETVQGIIAARLDALAPADKRVLQDAAVLGKVFWADAVAALNGSGPTGVDRALHELERRELVRRERTSSVEGKAEYGFRHVLVRDVAYGQIPRGERSEKHRAAAAWIASLGRSEDHAELLAHHYLEALEYARAAGRKTDEFGEPALHALREAGERAFALGAYASAVRYFAAALELTGEGDDSRGELLYDYGAACYWADGSGEDALVEAVECLHDKEPETAARAALLLARVAWTRGDGEADKIWRARVDELLTDEPRSVVRIEALVSRAGSHMVASEFAQAITLAKDALARLADIDRPDLRARALDVLGCSRVGQGDEGGIEDERRAIEIAREGRAVFEFHHVHNNLAYSYTRLGRLREADEVRAAWGRAFEEIPATALNRAWFAAGEVEVDFLSGRWDVALEGVDEFLGARPEGRYLDSQLQALRAQILFARDRTQDALADADAAVDLASRAGDAQVVAPALCTRATLLLLTGREEEARADFDRLLGTTQLTDDVSTEPAFAWLAHDLGRGAEVEHIFEDSRGRRWVSVGRAILAGDPVTAADLLEEIGDRPAEAYARLRAGGPHLQRALEFYRSVGATRYVREAEELMGASA